MSIITLFCKIDGFFLAHEKWMATHCLPEVTPPETRGCPAIVCGVCMRLNHYNPARSNRSTPRCSVPT